MAKAETMLSKCGEAFYIYSMIWREIRHFSTNAVRTVIASENYDEEDCYRNYKYFTAAVNATQK
jgi:hypothetical protein